MEGDYERGDLSKVSFFFLLREKSISYYERELIYMIKKFKNFCEKPITWGAYFKVAGISFALCTLATVAYAVYCSSVTRSFYRDSKDETDDED